MMRGALSLSFGAALCAGIFGAADVAAQSHGAIVGRVTLAAGGAAGGATVEILDLNRRARADEAGAFRFDAVPPGDYVLRAESARGGTSVGRVSVTAGAETSVDMTLELATHHETVVVTARAGAALADEIAQPATVLAGAELSAQRLPTLGETLAQQPGVSSTYFGPGASRPVIRGLGGDRIRILQAGLGTGDASSTSPDHAVSFDPLTARRIEVLRGPATLLYGSSAVGGAVNVIDDRIPAFIPDRRISGVLELAGASAANDFSGGASLTGGGGIFAWHADYLRRETDDVSIPGFAEAEALRREEEEEGAEHEQATGVLENSAVESEGGAIGASIVRDWGYFGVAASMFDTLYGVPGHAHHGEEQEGEGEGHEGEEEEEESVRVDMAQRRGDLRTEYNRPFGIFRAARLRVGLTDYEHSELEGDAVGTRFTNQSWEARLDLPHRDAGPLRGSVGVQLGNRDFEAIGEEAFVPPTTTGSFAVFAFEEIGREAVRLHLGARVERQSVEARGDEPADRDFTGVSGSVGMVWNAENGYGASVSVARSVKLPNAEELFSNGPHLATRAFEIGDPDLDPEKSLGIDFGLRKRTGRFTGSVTGFMNRFDDYIFEELIGEEEDGLQVVQFVQRNADFIGMEAAATLDLIHGEPHHLDLELSGDYVRAEIRDGDPLPRIPPLRVGGGLHYHGDRFNARVGVRRVAAQDRIGAFERPTDGYTLVDAGIGVRFVARRAVYDLSVRGTNLTDEEARNHVSFLKDLAPLPGRDVRAVLRVTF
jgi:iron complex outermembrane receptor protein